MDNHLLGRRLTPSQRRETLVGILFVVPALTCIVVFVFIPIVRSLILSLYDYDVVSKKDFIGLGNFAAMAQDPKWMQALQKTLLYVVMFVPSMLVISLLLALMIKHITSFSGFFRTTFFMPIIVSSTAAGAIFKMVFNKKTGFVNLFIAFIHYRMGYSCAMSLILFVIIMAITFVQLKATSSIAEQ